MTPVDKDDFEDADLARRLAALPQPEPSAELDAAIFAQIQKDLAPGPAAANDPATELATEPRRPSLLRRYRAPLAFAASLAGIAILLPVFRTMQHKEEQQVNVQVISEDAVLPAAPPMENADVAAPVASAPAKPAAPKEQKREAGILDERLAKPVPPPAQPPMLAMPTPEEAPVPPSPPAVELSRAAAPVPVPEPVRAAPAAVPEYAPAPVPPPAPAAVAPAAKSVTPVEVTGRRNRVQDPKAWLNSIEHMLDEGETAPAAEQWKRFRLANPDYPVPEALAQRLKALE